MEKIRDMILYCGLNKEDYNNVRQNVCEENRKAISAFSLIAIAGFIAVAINTIVRQENISYKIYLVIAAVFVVVWLLNRFLSRKYPGITIAFAMLFVVLLLGAGVFMALIQSEERTTMLLPFFAFASLIFCFRVLYFIIIMVATEVVYLILISSVQTGHLLTVNVTNTVIFCFTGMCVGVFMMITKYKKHHMDVTNRFLLERDSLTSLLNRRSYENELQVIVARGTPVIIGSFDINGLKSCNDTKGHEAGDELIKGAAECISQVFGKYGKVFRTGGDEFFAIIDGNVYDVDVLKRQFKETVSSWKGELVDKIDISCGLTVLEHDYENNLSEALRTADRLMYEDKHNYYSCEGRDRRTRASF